MPIDGDGDTYQLTPDEFQRLEESILRDVLVLKGHTGRGTLVKRHVALAEDNLNWARELRTNAKLHAAEICLVEALLKVNDALAAE